MNFEQAAAPAEEAAGEEVAATDAAGGLLPAATVLACKAAALDSATGFNLTAKGKGETEFATEPLTAEDLSWGFVWFPETPELEGGTTASDFAVMGTVAGAAVSALVTAGFGVAAAVAASFLLPAHKNEKGEQMLIRSSEPYARTISLHMCGNVRCGDTHRGSLWRRR
jgi:hypothetical protein